MHTYAAPSQHVMAKCEGYPMSAIFQGSSSCLALDALRAGIIPYIIVILVTAAASDRHACNLMILSDGRRPRQRLRSIQMRGRIWAQKS